MLRRREAMGLLPALALGASGRQALAQPGADAAAALPADAATLLRLRALQPNQAARLGRARVVGDFNEVARRFRLHVTGPQARDFSLKMPWAPERGRSLFLGANHGSPHRLNDVWEFDLSALAWVLLYAPDLPRNYGGLGDDASDVVFRDGVLTTRRGGPAIIGHTWSGLSYDAQQQRLLFMGVWVAKQEPLIQQLGGNPAERYAGPPLWAFTPSTAGWQPLKAAGSAPRAAMGGLLEYVPELGGTLWHTNSWEMQATWLYDGNSGRWRLLAGGDQATKDFTAHAPGREAVGYHDPVRRLLVVQHRHDTFHFDTATLRWRKVAAGVAGEAPDGHDAQGSFHFEPSSGHGLLVNLASNELWAYDPEAVRWQRLSPSGPPMPSGPRRLACMDRRLKVLAVIDDTEVWALRYR